MIVQTNVWVLIIHSRLRVWVNFFAGSPVFFSATILEATIFLALIQPQTHPDELSAAHTNRRYVLFIFINTYSKFAYRVTPTHKHTHFLNGRSAKALSYCAIRCYSRNIIVISRVELNCYFLPSWETCRTSEYFISTNINTSYYLTGCGNVNIINPHNYTLSTPLAG